MYSISQNEGAHAPREGPNSYPEQQVEVIRQESPRIDRERFRLRQCGEAPDKIIPVLVIPENDLAVQPAAHHVVEDTGGSETRGGRHRKA